MSLLDDIPPSHRLDRLLLLDEVAPDAFRSVTPDSNLNGEVFGGQYLALSVAAAMRSAGGRAPHAMHATFLRGARAAEAVDYHVERTRDGRAFAHRRVTASQDGKEAFRAEISLHDWEDGQLSHMAPMPDMPPPEDLVRLHDFVRDNADALSPIAVRRVLGRTSFENCFTKPGLTVVTSPEDPALNSWLYPNDPPSPGDAVAFYATVAYLSDACGNFACRALHAPSVFDGSTASATLNVSIWFHARPRELGWVLYANESPFAGGGLGINRALMFARDGQLLASVVQEALIRKA